MAFRCTPPCYQDVTAFTREELRKSKQTSKQQPLIHSFLPRIEPTTVTQKLHVSNSQMMLHLKLPRTPRQACSFGAEHRRCACARRTISSQSLNSKPLYFSIVACILGQRWGSFTFTPQSTLGNAMQHRNQEGGKVQIAPKDLPRLFSWQPNQAILITHKAPEANKTSPRNSWYFLSRSRYLSCKASRGLQIKSVWQLPEIAGRKSGSNL